MKNENCNLINNTNLKYELGSILGKYNIVGTISVIAKFEQSKIETKFHILNNYPDTSDSTQKIS